MQQPVNPGDGQQIGTNRARQGVTGHNVVIVLVAGLVLALMAWAAVEAFTR